jgi:hypothetical protein
MHEYRYTMRGGWCAVAGGNIPAYVADGDDLGEWLCEQGYRQLAQSHAGRCNVGHFYVWHQQEVAHGDLAAYAVEIDQVDDASVVWIETLPALWEFIRRYGGVGVAMYQLFEGDIDELEEEEGIDA